MIVGIPKEIMHDEARVAAIPDTVKKMVAAGMTVLFEKGAGEGSHYHDKDYLAAGATILEDCEEIFAKSDVILKVKDVLFRRGNLAAGTCTSLWSGDDPAILCNLPDLFWCNNVLIQTGYSSTGNEIKIELLQK